MPFRIEVIGDGRESLLRPCCQAMICLEGLLLPEGRQPLPGRTVGHVDRVGKRLMLIR
jgi:hypothetical protein